MRYDDVRREEVLLMKIVRLSSCLSALLAPTALLAGCAQESASDRNPMTLIAFLLVLTLFTILGFIRAKKKENR